MRLIWIAGLLVALGATTAPAAEESSPYWFEASNLSEAEGLVDRMHYEGADELPLEALAYYQEAERRWRAGDTRAAEHLLELSTRLDPSLVDAHLLLARIHFPGSFVADLVAAGGAAGTNFRSQHLALANLVLGGWLVFSLGLAAVIAFALAQIAPRVHHVGTELLHRWLPGPVAWVAAILLLACPLLWRIGAWPALLALAGFMWWWMHPAERRWTGVLVGWTALTPVLLWALSPALLGPLDPHGRATLIDRTMHGAYSPGLLAAVDGALEKNPEDADLHFARGLLQKRGGRFDGAQASFERALELSAPEAACFNNLGVIAYHREDYDRAVRLFRQAVERDPELAAGHYNLSQAYAKKLFFEKADEELREANRLSFNRIREVIKNQSGGPNGILLDEPLAASASWSAAWKAPHALPGLPGWMAPVFPAGLALLPLLGLPLFGLGLLAGRKVHRTLASFDCTNCGRPVCRRCLRRIKRRPYCQSCGDALLQIQSAAYSRLVLDSRSRRSGRIALGLGRLVAWVLPAYHTVRTGHTGLSVLLALPATLGVLTLVVGTEAVSRIPSVDTGADPWWPLGSVLALGLALAGNALAVWRIHPQAEPVEEIEDQDPFQELEPEFDPAADHAA